LPHIAFVRVPKNIVNFGDKMTINYHSIESKKAHQLNPPAICRGLRLVIKDLRYRCRQIRPAGTLVESFQMP
jgi:hypothetical protein